jgi:hypothetical protein
MKLKKINKKKPKTIWINPLNPLFESWVWDNLIKSKLKKLLESTRVNISNLRFGSLDWDNTIEKKSKQTMKFNSQ